MTTERHSNTIIQEGKATRSEIQAEKRLKRALAIREKEKDVFFNHRRLVKSSVGAEG